MQIHDAWSTVSFLLSWIFLAVFVEAVVELLLEAGPLTALRAYVARIHNFFADLISCGYCLSVWVSFSIAWILPSPLVGDSYIIGFCNEYLWWFINGIILHRLSNFVHHKLGRNSQFEVIE